MKSMGMKKLTVAAAFLTAGLLAACGSGKQGQKSEEEAFVRTPETEKLLAGMKRTAGQGIMFGHHDDTVYGIGWEGEEGRSDVQSVCGDYPAIVSFDLGELELGGPKNLDKVAFDTLRKEILKQYRRGGMVSLSWHARNPKTGGDAWDVSDSTVVKSILPGGENHAKFAGWLGSVADFMNSLTTPEGVKIPVLFRPWHEHTGSWFWWGEKLCTPDEYKTLWHMTVDSLRTHGVDNALFAYSTGSEPQDTTQYLVRYPGDDCIDVLGFDTYCFDKDVFLDDMDRMLGIITALARTHDKVPAVTETGYEGIPDAKWWTGTLLPELEKYPTLSYVLVWRNAREKVTHFYAPYPGQVSADDFVEFYKNPQTLFAGDVKLYE